MATTWILGALTVFLTICGLEIFDRTNVAIISLSSRRPPRAVWAGAALAFTITTLTAVVLGQTIVVYLVSYLIYIRIVGGGGIIAFGLWNLLKEGSEKLPDVEAGAHRRAFTQTLLVILALEMGDDTQVLTILFVAWIGNVVLVFASAILALLLVMSLGVTGGQYLKDRLSTRKLEFFSSFLIIGVGIATIVYALLFR